MTYKVTVSYDGSYFHGWAKQPSHTTVQQTIEEALNRLLNKKIPIYGSGRTDSYVHALNQVFSFSYDGQLMDFDNFVIALNNLLPKSIRIKSIKKINDKFNARFNAKSKTYIYVINQGEFDLFHNDYFYNYNKKINIRKIKKGAKLLIGKHNFLSFSTSTLNDTTRTINYIKISKKQNNVLIKVNGNGFLRNQVRMIVGSLLDFNEDKKTLDDFKNLLKNPQKGSCITKAPGCGLYLYKVEY